MHLRNAGSGQLIVPRFFRTIHGEANFCYYAALNWRYVQLLQFSIAEWKQFMHVFQNPQASTTTVLLQHFKIHIPSTLFYFIPN